jgi:hypothetical protein
MKAKGVYCRGRVYDEQGKERRGAIEYSIAVSINQSIMWGWNNSGDYTSELLLVSN